MDLMRVGLFNDRWWVECNLLVDNRDSWSAPAADWPVVTRFRHRAERQTGCYSVVFTDSDSGKCSFELRFDYWFAKPQLLVKAGRLLVVAEELVIEIDPLTPRILWEHDEEVPVYAIWMLDDGRLRAISELRFFILDPRGKELHSHGANDVIMDFRRESPHIHLTDFLGGRYVIDERSGELVSYERGPGS